MVIYGLNTTPLRTEPLLGVPCPSCATPNKLQVSIAGRYAHAYWIPFFPFGKIATASCTHCGLSLQGKALPEAAQEQARDLKKQTSLPLWTWSGMGLLAAGLLWASIAGRHHAQAEAGYLAAPHPGDIYTVRANDKATDYSLLKVVDVKGKTVDVVANEYQIDNSHPLDELNSPAKYSKTPYPLTQFELQIMKNKGQLTSVDRPEE
ncbi:hypothetical protein [Hymenobacter rubidus]|uniref:hypothetical protein n=1 Tax=Hymenobacter rubidus TaxID=1441626 RepID=UPI00191F1D1B|nr:hypothetical protein [Hymenobacter rubidus]